MSDMAPVSDTTVPTDTAGGQGPGRESGRHPVNVGHLVMGTALLGLLGVWALVVGDVVDGGDVRWLLPAPWVLGGAAGLIALATSGHRGHETRQVGWVPPPPPAPSGSTDQTAPLDPVEPVDPVDPADETTTEPPTEENR